MADVELLPLPSGNVAHLIAAQAAEIEALRAEVSGLRAARIAYANEFPATEDGDPDTGNIHANIRALKARAEQLAAEVESLRRLVQERDTMLGKRLCAGTNADGKPRCLVLAEEHARAKRLAEALRDARRALAFAAQHLPECNEPYERANAALAQENRNG